MIGSIGSAITGMAGAVDRFDKASARIARPEPADPVGDRVVQLVAQHAFEANVATVRTADEMLGTLINIIA
jgi:flagellar basal body rod protein FlgC